MINSEPTTDHGNSTTQQDEAVNSISLWGAKGAVVLAGLATAIVVGIWFVFYALVFLPRAVAP